MQRRQQRQKQQRLPHSQHPSQTRQQAMQPLGELWGYPQGHPLQAMMQWASIQRPQPQNPSAPVQPVQQAGGVPSPPLDLAGLQAQFLSMHQQSSAQIAYLQQQTAAALALIHQHITRPPLPAPAAPAAPAAPVAPLGPAVPVQPAPALAQGPAVLPPAVAAPVGAAAVAGVAPAPPVHRQRGLGVGSSDPLSALVAAVQQLPNPAPRDLNDDDPDSDNEVSTHNPTTVSHSVGRPLSSFETQNPYGALIPFSLRMPAAGSALDGQQQLTRLLTTFAKGTVKYANLEELIKAIDDWRDSVSRPRSGWTAEMVLSLSKYRDLILQIGLAQGLVITLKYHKLFCESVERPDNPYDMFPPMDI